MRGGGQAITPPTAKDALIMQMKKHQRGCDACRAFEMGLRTGVARRSPDWDGLPDCVAYRRIHAAYVTITP
jgi:hypothetical protein